MVADYLANGGDQKLELDNLTITENTPGTVTVTYTDHSTNKYKFSGIVGIEFTKGTTSSYPKVVLKACSKVGASEVIFGEGTASH